jgi:dissimilatory sulfite reductase (desulfoviridin) alpha/beta subunit
MEWEKEAEESLVRVPFFVRGRVRKRVEEEARQAGAAMVRLSHVLASRRKFLENMADEVQGFQVEACFGSGGCPNRIQDGARLADEIRMALEKMDIRGYLIKKTGGALKMHHEFRVTLADCPNACSRPQIVDIGLLGASRPMITETACTACFACVEACPDGAIRLDGDEGRPVIDAGLCLACGRCIAACPGGTLAEAESGWRVLVGGKLGRHPRLGQEVEGLFAEKEILVLVEAVAEYWMAHGENGERLGVILEREGLGGLKKKIIGASKKEAV